jgi:hypothetical protein
MIFWNITTLTHTKSDGGFNDAKKWNKNQKKLPRKPKKQEKIKLKKTNKIWTLKTIMYENKIVDKYSS